MRLSDANLEILRTKPQGTRLYLSIFRPQIVFQAQINNSSRLGTIPFSTPYLVKANTPIAITARPTTTNGITLYGYNSDGIKSERIMPPNDYAYAVRRINNSGAFSDYSTKSTVIAIYLYGYYVEQGVNNASYQLGI